MNFNKQPYYDDFNADKNFLKVLFKPGLPVQVRELNQVQSIQHHQLERFANHMFKTGSVINGQSPMIQEMQFVTVNDTTTWSSQTQSVNMTLLQKNYTLFGSTSGIKADIIMSVAKEGTDPISLYINYTCTGIDGIRSTFIPGEVLQVKDLNDVHVYDVKVRCPTCPGYTESSTVPVTGTANVWTIPDATYYVQGWFVDFSTEMILGEKYTSFSASYKVGFDVVESVITAEDDSTLYDNVLGYPNYNAAGADRYKITLVPVIKPLAYEDNEMFIKLAEVVDGTVTYVKTKTDYAQLMDTLAERTYDESGNYTVTPFRVSLFDHIKSTKTPTGLYTEEEGGDDNLFVAAISSGRAYVKGYQVDKIAESKLIMEKARDTNIMRDFYNIFSELQYILIKVESGSSFIPTDTSGLSVFNNYSVSIYNGPVVNGAATGTEIGTITPYDFEYYKTVSGSKIFKLYFTSVTMAAGVKFSTARSFTRTGGTVQFLASAVNDDNSGSPRIYGTKGTLIWKIADYVKSTRDADNSTVRSLSYMNRRKFQATLNSSGRYTWTAVSGEYFDGYNSLRTFGGTVSNGVFTEVDLSTALTITPTSISVLVSGGAGKTFIMFHNVLKSDALEKTKTLITTTETGAKMDNENIIHLTKADGYRLRSVIKYPDSNPASTSDVTSMVTFYSGLTDQAYTQSYLKWEDSYNAAISFDIEYDYFEHGAGDFFSVDSYQNTINNPDIPDFSMSDIPEYTDQSGTVYSLRDCLDFRPIIIGGVMSGSGQPSLNAAFLLDLEYYLPRTDLVVIDKDSNIYQKKGISAETPLVPELAKDGSEMAIYRLEQKPFVSSVTRDINCIFIENKRYTMEDIGGLDSKLRHLEEYTTLTLLETGVLASSIKDSEGLDRFKNGFIADDFHDFSNSAHDLTEFKSCLDTESRTLRPEFDFFPVEFELDSENSTGVVQLGPVVMREYVKEAFIKQPYATKELSVNPYYILSKTGQVTPSPAYDNWADVENSVDSFQDSSTGEIVLVKDGQRWGSWRNISTSSVPWKNVSNVVAKTLVRSNTIQFYASNLLANTRVYCFFDGKNVSQYCRLWNGAEYGSALTTDAKGCCVGEFVIPEGMFYVGQKKLRLTNSSTDSRSSTELKTSAEGIIVLGGLKYNIQDDTLNVLSPIQNLGINESVVETLAQSFSINTACFITGLDVYFSSAMIADEFTVKLVTTETGYPTAKVLSEKRLTGDQISTSNNGTVSTYIEFPYPVYVEAGKDYAILISGKDPRSKLWISKLGQRDIKTNTLVDVQPSLGNLFKKQTTSWVVSNTEDLKFKLYRARFNGTSTNVILKNKTFSDPTIYVDPFETQSGSTRMRVYAKSHGMAVGDVFTPEFVQPITLNVTSLSAPLTVGQTISSATGTAKIISVSALTATSATVNLKTVRGYFTTGQSFSAASLRFTFNDSHTVSSIYGNTQDIVPTPAITGTINTTWNPTFNGVAVSVLNNSMSVIEVDSADSFIVQLPAAATGTGVTGGKVYLRLNRKFDVMNLSGSFMKYSATGAWLMTGTNLDYSSSAATVIQFQTEYELSQPLKVLNEAQETSRNIDSITLTGTFVAPNTLISPVLNTDTFHLIGISNHVDNNVAASYNVSPNATGRLVAETHSANGSTSYKYVSNTVTLSDPALDLKVLLSVNKPQDTDFDVYVKTSSPYAQEVIDTKAWVKVEGVWKDFVCNSKDDFREVEFILSDLMPTTYGSAEFKEFKIKLVAKGKNSATPVLFKNLRAIAVT